MKSKRPKKESNKKKPIAAEITISSALKDGYFQLCYRDNGRGIQTKRLLQKARKTEKWSAAEINSWDEAKIAVMIYEPCISTSDNPDLISGRGMGMDIIKQKVNKQGGEISLDFETGGYTSFTITLPL